MKVESSVLRRSNLSTLGVAGLVLCFMALSSCSKDEDNAESGNNLINNHEFVDLGLSSGLKWATTNVGASRAEEYGYYFAWGETEAKETYSIGTYKYAKGSNVSYTKYTTSDTYGVVDNRTTLESIDDAASVKWGSSWRIPTKAEFDELKKECTWTWSELNGTKGYLVVGPNGKSIFFPAGGWMNFAQLVGAGNSGFYWASDLNETYNSGSYYLYMESEEVTWYNNYRVRGYCVRPVSL